MAGQHTGRQEPGTAQTQDSHLPFLDWLEQWWQGPRLAPALSWLPRGAAFLWAQNLCYPAVTRAAWPFLPNLVVTHIP